MVIKKTDKGKNAIQYITGMFGYDMNLGKCEYMEVRQCTRQSHFSLHLFMFLKRSLAYGGHREKDFLDSRFLRSSRHHRHQLLHHLENLPQIFGIPQN